MNAQTKSQQAAAGQGRYSSVIHTNESGFLDGDDGESEVPRLRQDASEADELDRVARLSEN